MPSTCFIRVGLALLVCAAPALAQNASTSVSVDAKAAQHPISPNIYGFAFGTANDLTATGFTMNREGGDLGSTYNWKIDATNHANDYFFETFLDPDYDGDNFITTTRAANVGAQPLLTIPMLGYLGNLGANNASLWSFSIKKYGAQTGADPYQPDAGNGISAAQGNPFITGNDPLEANVLNSVAYQQSWVQHLIDKWGNEASGGLKYYIMDNEPSLWNSTHRDVHPAPETYDEIYNYYVNYAAAVRALDPNAVIVGPEEWSWWALFLSGYDQKNGIGAADSDYNTHNQTYYYPWLLQQLYTYEQNTGNRLLDVLSIHYYPMELSNSDDDSPSAQLIRNQSTRVLWDPAYVDPSWFNQVGINNGIVNLIATLKGWVSQYYPGLQTGITEYNWGDEANLNGATTQADVLGIFGREGLDLATRWTVPVNPSPTYLALEMYRNYDGNLSAFGDTSVSDAVVNPDFLSSFAAVRSSDSALTVMVINKQQGATPVTISLANFGTTGTAQAWQIASASQATITQLASVPVTGNAITATLPSQSITLFVIPAGDITSKPTAPTGLAAAVGDGTATLTWSGGGGATSYTVKRGTVSGTHAIIGSVPDTAPASYPDTLLTNGTTYYYVVSATNSAGTSPDSDELAVTPVVPPTFTSSATATPNPVTQGASTTIKATVTCTANVLTNGNIQILVVDPNGHTAMTQNYSSQSFTANQSQNYSFDVTPSVAGTYTVEVGVFSATWQLWNWNASAATITVNSAVVFTSSITAPSTLTGGDTGSIMETVTETGPVGLSNANVELQIFGPSGPAVATQVWSGQDFTAGGSQMYSYSWMQTDSLPAGAYTVDIGVFDSGWTHQYYWNADATITLSGTKPLAFTSSAAAPATLAAGGTGSISTAVNETGAGSLMNGNVELQIFNAANTAVATQVWTGQNFAAGQTSPYNYSWATAGALPPGSYTVNVGVFDSSWSNLYYWNADATITVMAPASAQTITFGPLSDQTLDSPAPALSATATSGLMVAFSSNTPGVCMVSGTAVTIVGSGGCAITANQPGDSNWAAAPSVTQTFTVYFGDISSADYYYNAVALLAQHGITAGCGSNDYCATDIVTRAQMAIFMVRAVYGGDNFAASTTRYFTDVQPADFGFKWIQKLYELGITSGCGTGLYCPNDSVTRDQMAIFIIRVRLGSNATFTYSTTPSFTDDPDTDFAFKWVQRMAQEKITSGCAANTYCPNDPVIRGDMAIFIMRGAFNQLLPAGTPMLTQISPSTLAVGGSGTYTVTGVNTNFVQGTTTIGQIPGVSIGTVTVTSPTTLTVQLTAGGSATPQPYSILAITGTEEDVLPNGLTIQ